MLLVRLGWVMLSSAAASEMSPRRATRRKYSSWRRSKAAGLELAYFAGADCLLNLGTPSTRSSSASAPSVGSTLT